MAIRTGIPTMLEIATRLCRFITKYQGVIQTRYPDSAALHAALAAALVACAALQVELAAHKEWGD